MELLTKEIREKLPKLYANEEKKPEDIKIIVKFFDPTGSWTWYATEGQQNEDNTDFTFFGLVRGFENELGYFTLNELKSAKAGIGGLRGLPIERDRHFGFEHTLKEAMDKQI